MDRNTKDILETLAFIKDRMVTKEDVEEIIDRKVPPMLEEAINRTVPPMIEEAVRPIHQELRGIRHDLDHLTDQVHNITGYRKEIDYALTCIVRIEKHLRLKPLAH